MQLLDQAYGVTEEQAAFFREQGYVKLKNVLSSDVLGRMREEITRVVAAVNPLINKPMHERTTYEKAFIQVTNLWRMDERVADFVFSRRLAQLAADLMGVDGVRLYHDQALYKEPSGGFTPWHADQYYWPLDTRNTCTVWIPLQDTPLEMGPLEFSARSHHFEIGRDLSISDESEQLIQQALAEQHFPHVVEPFEAGEVSFHYGWTFHRAGPNTTQNPRAVMTVIYFADGARLTDLKRPEHHADRDAFMPGTQPGDTVQTDMNPLLYSRS